MAATLLVPGAAVACSASVLLAKLATSDVWSLLLWRALVSGSLVALACAVSALPLDFAN